MLAVTRFSKLLLLSGCLSVAGCACVTTSIDSELAEMVADVANIYAADARLSVWEVKVNETSDGWTIEGKTDRKEALDELNSRLHAKKMPVDVCVTVLPQDNAQIGDKPWALVNVSVATVKKEPRFAGLQQRRLWPARRYVFSNSRLRFGACKCPTAISAGCIGCKLLV